MGIFYKEHFHNLETASLSTTSSSYFTFLISRCCAPFTACFTSQNQQVQKNYPPEKAPIEIDQPTLTLFPTFPSLPALHIIPESHVQEVGLGAYTTRKPRSRNKSTDTMRSALTSWKKQHKRPGTSGTARTSDSTTSSIRNLRISAPTNFRHVSSQSYNPLAPYGPTMMQPMNIPVAIVDDERPLSFHPLELSIYEDPPERRMSPIFPIQWPAMPPASRLSGHHKGVSLDSVDDANFRAMSFHVPRRPLNSNAELQHDAMTVVYKGVKEAIDDDRDAPPIPPKSRKRAYTSPETERIVKRIASAMIEKERLEQAIDDAIERESIYLGSRPSTSYSNIDFTSLEPMPAIPVLPPMAPSFSERLRPGTSGSMTASQSPLSTTVPPLNTTTSTPGTHGTFFLESSPASSFISTSCRSYAESPTSPITPLVLTPSLPLVLRPPLRKKQAFKRVSSWLFLDQNQNHSRLPSNSSSSLTSASSSSAGKSSTGATVPRSLDAVTNSPIPLANRDAYYQCIPPFSSASHRPSKKFQNRNQAHDHSSTPRSETTWLSDSDNEDDLMQGDATLMTDWFRAGMRDSKLRVWQGEENKNTSYAREGSRQSKGGDIVTPAMVVPVVGVAF